MPIQEPQCWSQRTPFDPAPAVKPFQRVADAYKSVGNSIRDGIPDAKIIDLERNAREIVQAMECWWT